MTPLLIMISFNPSIEKKLHHHKGLDKWFINYPTPTLQRLKYGTG